MSLRRNYPRPDQNRREVIVIDDDDEEDVVVVPRPKMFNPRKRSHQEAIAPDDEDHQQNNVNKDNVNVMNTPHQNTWNNNNNNLPLPQHPTAFLQQTFQPHFPTGGNTNRPTIMPPMAPTGPVPVNDTVLDQDLEWLHEDDALAFWEDNLDNNHELGTIEPQIPQHTSKESGLDPGNSDDLSEEALGEAWKTLRTLTGTLLPDICPKYLRKLFDERKDSLRADSLASSSNELAGQIVTLVLEQESYPKAPKTSKRRKMINPDEPDAEEEAGYASANRPQPTYDETQQMRLIFMTEFDLTPMLVIDRCMTRNPHLFPCYLALDAATNPKKQLNKPRMAPPPSIFGFDDLKRELEVVKKKLKRDKDRQKEMEIQAKIQEERERKARAEGNTIECQCCFSDTATFMSTHCSAKESHFFCLDCAKGSALAQLEFQRWKFTCMDSSGCDAEFSEFEKRRFLPKDKLALAERLTLQEALRGMDGFEGCPECDFGEIYPPIEQNKIFECKNEDCDATLICRLCKKPSHLPKTCEEYAKELGVSEKNAIAEAMTEALIRKCPKCSTSIVKEDGCNKMTCSKCGCYFCDVCGKDITKERYAHFRENGPCPQGDDEATRAAARIEEAEKAAKAKALAENNHLKEEDLKFNFSDDLNNSRGPRRALGPGLGLQAHLDAAHRRAQEHEAHHDRLRVLQARANGRHHEAVAQRLNMIAGRVGGYINDGAQRFRARGPAEAAQEDINNPAAGRVNHHNMERPAGFGAGLQVDPYMPYQHLPPYLPQEYGLVEYMPGHRDGAFLHQAAPPPPPPLPIPRRHPRPFVAPALVHPEQPNAQMGHPAGEPVGFEPRERFVAFGWGVGRQPRGPQPREPPEGPPPDYDWAM